MMNDWTQRAIECDEAGNIDGAIDILFEETDRLMFAGEFVVLNGALERFEVDRASTTLLVGLLACTRVAHEKLAGRPRLFERITETLQRRGLTEDEIRELVRGLLHT